MVRLLAFLPLLLLLVACPEPPNYLDGSIGDSFPLEFDEVRIRKYQETGEVQIEYMKDAEEGGGKDIVVQITVTTPEGGFPANEEIKFETVEGKVHRIAAGDDFPLIDNGRIQFSQGGNKIGEQTTGEFNILFENKRTLRGNFDAKLEEAKAG